MSRPNARRTAFAGVLSALSLVFLLMSSLIPMADYTAAALAGVVITALVIDFGPKAAWLSFGGVAVVGLLIVPNKECMLLYVFLFGYYPIAKSYFERIKFRWLEWLCKLVLFNAAVVAAYWLMIRVFGMEYLISDLPGTGPRVGIGAFLALANFAFILYDILLTLLIAIYCQRIRPQMERLLRR